MDGKLARGLTRDGLRRELREAPGTSDIVSQLTTRLALRLKHRGKLSKEECVEAFEKLRSVKDDPLTTTVVERFDAPGILKGTSKFDAALVGGYLYPEPISLVQFDERVRRYGLYYDRYSRKFIDVRTLGIPFYIREHAIKRFIERAGASYVSLTRSLWPGLLAIEALHHFLPSLVACPFVIPGHEGLFLCMRVLGTVDLNETGLTRLVVNEFGHDFKHEAAKQGVAQIGLVNTFIGRSELTHEQENLRSDLENLIERHRGVLTVSHFRRIMTDQDRLGLEKRFPGNFDLAAAEFQKFFTGSLWTRAVRMPSDTPLNKFDGDAVIEKSITGRMHL